MIDYVAVKNTIASEMNVELLRGLGVTLLREVEQRRQTLKGLDPILDPAFRTEESDRTQGLLGQTLDLEVMRTLVRDVFNGLESLDAQIARRIP